VLVTGGVADPWPTTSQTGTASQPVSGVVGSIGPMYLAPSGTWKMFEERSGTNVVALWRSSNGLTWERVPLSSPMLASATVFAIGSSGELWVVNDPVTGCCGHYSSFSRFTAGEWYGPVTVTGGSPAWVRSDGSTLVVGTTATSVTYSVDGGNTWIAGGAMSGVSSIQQTTVIGDVVHVASSSGLARWSFTTKAVVGTTNTTITNVQVFSAPASTSSLWAVVGGTSGGLSVWKSTDTGATWSSVATTVTVPYRAGVDFGSPRVLADGKVHLFGSLVVSGFVNVYEVSFDPLTSLWGTVTKTVTAQTSGALLVWPSQRVSGVQPATVDRWMVVTSGTQSAFAVSAGVADPWPTTSYTGTTSQPLSGVAGSLGSMSMAQSGLWRMIDELSGGNVVALWRTSDQLTWERVPLSSPMLASATVFAIGSDGELWVATDPVTGCCGHYSSFSRFTAGEWYGPVNVGLGSPAWIRSDGSTIVMANTGLGVNYSTNHGDAWNAGGVLTNVGGLQQATVVGDTVHIAGQTGLGRWSFTTKAIVGTTNTTITSATILAT
jgi:hypothetical protein